VADVRVRTVRRVLRGVLPGVPGRAPGRALPAGDGIEADVVFLSEEAVALAAQLIALAEDVDSALFSGGLTMYTQSYQESVYTISVEQAAAEGIPIRRPFQVVIASVVLLAERAGDLYSQLVGMCNTPEQQSTLLDGEVTRHVESCAMGLAAVPKRVAVSAGLHFVSETTTADSLLALAPADPAAVAPEEAVEARALDWGLSAGVPLGLAALAAVAWAVRTQRAKSVAGLPLPAKENHTGYGAAHA
jgi:hypothetical protein